MNKNERANIAAEYGFSHPQRLGGKPTYADLGTALSVGGSLLGAAMQDDSADKAVAAQNQASAEAIAEQRRQYDQGRADLAPWRNVGGAAINRIGALLGIGGGGFQPNLRQHGNWGPMSLLQTLPDQYQESDAVRRAIAGVTTRPGGEGIVEGVYIPQLEQEIQGFVSKDEASSPDFGSLNKKFTLADFWDDPVTKASFQFGLDEGTKALDRMAGARGNRNSGAQLKALTRFGTDYTGQKAGDSYNRFYGDQDRTYNRLAGVARTGQTATTNTALMGQNTANNVSGLISGLGNARGAAAIASGNAMSGGIQNAGNTLGNWLNGRNSPYQTPSFNPYSMSNPHW